jgi:DNA-binding MarR family transcriptional regulator
MMCPHQSGFAMPAITETTPRPCVCTSIRKAARVLARSYDAALATSGMNVTQLAVLRAVLRHPGEPLSRVAEDLAMDRTSLYRAIEALKKRRWVSLADGNDNRSRSASVTRSGQLALAQADPGWARTQCAIVGRFGQERWQAFVSELHHLLDCSSHIDASQRAPGEIN